MRITMTSKRQVTLPASLVKRLGLRKGAELEVIVTDNGILLQPTIPGAIPANDPRHPIWRWAGALEDEREGPPRENDHNAIYRPS